MDVNNLLVNVVHGWVALVGWEAALAVAGAADEFANELVEMSEEEATYLLDSGTRISCDKTYYWLEVLSLAGLFILIGAAPPPSRKLTETGRLPLLVDFKQPLKYGRRLTGLPL